MNNNIKQYVVGNVFYSLQLLYGGKSCELLWEKVVAMKKKIVNVTMNCKHFKYTLIHYTDEVMTEVKHLKIFLNQLLMNLKKY